jgi:glutathione reductase (NADPH)
LSGKESGKNRLSVPAFRSIYLAKYCFGRFFRKEAKEKGYNFTVEHKLVPEWFNSKRINAKVYAYKTLVDNKTGQIIGVHLVGSEAGEIINLFTLAMNSKTDVKQLKKMLFAYPTWGNDIKGMV